MNEPSSLLPVGDALARILAGAQAPLDAETVALAQARGRTLAARSRGAADAAARRCFRHGRLCAAGRRSRPHSRDARRRRR